MLKVIWDNGTPNCLPAWARDEIVERRLADSDKNQAILALRARALELRRFDAEAHGIDPKAAVREEKLWQLRHIAMPAHIARFDEVFGWND